jgi:hypothetical protein
MVLEARAWISGIYENGLFFDAFYENRRKCDEICACLVYYLINSAQGVFNFEILGTRSPSEAFSESLVPVTLLPR